MMTQQLLYSPIGRKLLPAALLLLHLLLLISSIQQKSLTHDEPYHYQYGYNISYFNSSRIDDEKRPFFSDSKMPFSYLNVIPGQIRDLFVPPPSEREAYIAHIRKNVLIGRYVTMIFSLLLGIYLYRWTNELYGRIAAHIVLFIYAFSPNILAHARLVTTDMYAICFITIALYYFWRFTGALNRRNAVLSAITLGIAQLTKYTALYLYPLFLLLLFIKNTPRVFGFVKEKNSRGIFESLQKAGKAFLLFLIINLLIINTGFLFNGSLRPLKEYQFKSERFQALQQHLRILQDVPLLLPVPFIEGIDWIFHHDKTGISFGNIYLLGKIQQTNTEEFVGFTGYYWLAARFKLPIAIQCVLAASLLYYCVKRKQYAFLKNELFLLLPACAYSLYFNFLHKTQIGIRHALVILPLLYIFSGSLFQDWPRFRRRTRFFLGALAAYFLVSVLSYHPHYLSYFNELVWDRKNAYKILADSNLDWNQNKIYLAAYLSEHPEVTVNPSANTTGTVLVSVNDLVGVSESPETYQWLREQYEPIDHIAYSYLIFEIP